MTMNKDASIITTVAATATAMIGVISLSGFTITTGGELKGSPAGSEGLTTSRPGAVVIDFNDAPKLDFTKVGEVNQKGATYSPDDALVINNGGKLVETKGAVPFSSSTQENTSAYLSLPTNSQDDEDIEQVSIQLPKPSSYWGMHWGSMDASNQIEFFRGDTRLARFTPDDFVSLGVGPGVGGDNQTEESNNPYINFSAEGSDQWFDKVVLTQLGDDDTIAFESDNHAYDAVPEPLTILGSGLALGFGALFKKQQSRRR
ncbi:MAG: PEP-CTERM sorting domain-containing protein [Coleofasciculus sp. B1-GNL1-01]|uniref:PEP-CTERM sorting domain-containing protein n=1 Tax=Coleofasciculus sp. B1-GNL1-01 TaxID=3068484 RepID=UPI0032FE1DBA